MLIVTGVETGSALVAAEAAWPPQTAAVASATAATAMVLRRRM